MKKIFTLLFIVLAGARSFAQYNTPQNYNWAFGTRAGVSFSTGSPVNTSSNLDQYEGSASVSSPTGALLFYTDGTNIWNSTGAIMPGSAGGLIAYSTWSTTQATLIAPVLSNPNRYYVFSIEEAEDYLTGDMGAMRMYYCIVDMTLAGGLGDVVAGTLGTFFASPVGEKQIIIPGNNCDLWLINHGRGNKNFYAYDITTTGISTTPVVSTLGNMTGGFSYGIGVIKSSPNRLHIVAQNWNDPTITGISGAGLNGTELYDFDPNTGIVSNCRLLDSLKEQYGAEFSPDNTKLYTMEDDPAAGVSRVCQYDVTGATAAAIRATKFTVASNAAEPYSDLKLAVNNKIYFGSLTSVPASYLSVINTPNASGAACGYANNVVTLSTVGYRYAQEGMPNVFQNVVHDTSFQSHDTTVCVIASTGIMLHAAAGTSYYWNDGTTLATHLATATGTYWVNVTSACSIISDTFHVHVGTTPISGSLTICPGGTTTLTNASTGGTWTSGNTAVATVGSSTGVVTGVSGGTATISYTAGVCTTTAIVTVSALPAITGTPAVCTGGTTTLSNTATGGTWSSSNTGIATVGSATGVVTGVAAGTSNVTYTSGGCAVSIVVTVSTTAAISGTLSLCQGSAVTLIDATAGGTWLSGTPAIATIGSATGVVNGISAGTTNITYTTAAGCTAHAVVTVNVLSPISGTPSVCLGYTTSLTDAVTGGTWTSSNTGVATIGSTSGVVTSVAVGTTVVSYVAPSGCSTAVTVSVITVAPIAGTPYVCVGSTTTLSSTSAGGTWGSSNASIASIGVASGVVNGISAGTATITYTISTGCTNTIVVTVYPLPAAITGAADICIGTGTTLTDATGGGTWSSSNTAIATIGSSSGVLSAIAAGTVTITYRLSTGCIATYPFVVDPLPTVISGPANVCIGLTVTLTDAAAGGTWGSSAPGIATIGAATGVVMGIASGTTAITYTLPTGCSITTVVNVGTLPPAPITANLNYCQGDTVVPPLTAIVSGLQWYTTAIGGLPLGAAPVPATMLPGTTTWYVSQNAGGCEGPRAPLTVTVHIRVPRPFITPQRPSTCQYLPLGYNYAGPSFPGETFAWTVPPNAAITGGSAGSSGIVVTFDTSLGYNYVVLTVGDGYVPCDVTDSVPMTVFINSPNAAFYIKPDVCVGDSVLVALTYTGPGVTDYIWNFGPAGSYDMVVASSNHGGPFKIVWPAPGIYTVTLTAVSNDNCPSKPIVDTFQVHAYPDASIAPPVPVHNYGYICAGDSMLFSPNVYIQGDTYSWSPLHFFYRDDKQYTYGKVERTGYVMLSVTDPFGCTAIDSVYIDAEPCCQVLFPNAFTPNGDGKNDVFRPITQGHHKVHELRIVNRFGQTVFETADEKGAWNGQFNGVPQDLGVYFYYFKYDCDGKTIEEKGDVTLVR